MSLSVVGSLTNCCKKNKLNCQVVMSYRHRNNSRNMHQQVQSAINEGRLKFIESPQMKLDKDTFPTNMNMVELEGKKVLVQSSQVKMTKGKEVIIGEERPLRMIKPNSLKDGQWQKNEGGGGGSRNATQRSPSTSLWPSTKKAGLASGGTKIGPSEISNRTVQFP
jgi:hypothetical protein